MEKTIKDLTETQLKEMITETINNNGNFIEVAGCQVHSSNESLRTVEKTINRLVDKHQDFLLLRKKLKLNTGFDE